MSSGYKRVVRRRIWPDEGDDAQPRTDHELGNATPDGGDDDTNTAVQADDEDGEAQPAQETAEETFSDEDDDVVQFAAVPSRAVQLQEELRLREAREKQHYASITGKLKTLVATIAQLKEEARSSKWEAARSAEQNKELLAKIEALKDQQEVRNLLLLMRTLLL